MSPHPDSSSNCVSLSSFRDLFNAAFVSCWSELTEQDQDSLINSLQKALMSQDIPEIVQILLNLAEFMEHSDKVCALVTVITMASIT